MSSPSSRGDRRAAAVLVLAFAMLATTAGRKLWAGSGAPWWTPFALWVLLILLSFGMAVRSEEHER